MRAALVLVLLALTSLSGCAENGPKDEGGDPYDDFEYEKDSETGVILGVVVDQAIVPVADATVTVEVGGNQLTKTSDQNGRFVFAGLEPGTYFVVAKKIAYEPVQSSVVVVAGVEEPPILKLQIERLFNQDPYMQTQRFAGFVGCAYSLILISSTCVNDYTRVDPTGTCPNGCLPQTTGVVDQREYRSEVNAGWQTILWEMVWDSSVSGTVEQMAITVSYAERVGAGHWYASSRMPQPYRMQVNVGEPGPGAQIPADTPEFIDPEGQDNLWNMIGAGPSDVAVQQEVEIFQSNFYFGQPPEGWALLNGDENPF